MAILLSLLLSALQIFFTCKKNLYGLCFFLVVRILVPEIMRSPIPSLSMNSFMIAILVVIVGIKGGLSFKEIVRDKYGKFLLLFTLLPLLLLPFSDTIDISLQFKYWFQIFLTDYLPAFIALMIVRECNDTDCIIRTFLFSGMICMFYGFFSFFTNSNPYLDFFTSNYAEETVLGDKTSLYDLIVSRYTSSTFTHTNGYGYFLTYLILLVFLIKDKLDSKLWFILLLVIIMSIVASTKRSPVVVAGFLFFYYLYNNKRMIVPAILLVVVCFILIFSLPQFESIKNVFMAAVFFWDDGIKDSLDVTGSSMELRIRQTLYPFEEIKENMLLGHGVSWCRSYIEINREIHPLLYGFETLTSTVICELGLIGIPLYYKFFTSAYGVIKGLSINNKMNLGLAYVIGILLMYFATSMQYVFYFLITIIAFKPCSNYSDYLKRPLFENKKSSRI